MMAKLSEVRCFVDGERVHSSDRNGVYDGMDGVDQFSLQIGGGEDDITLKVNAYFGSMDVTSYRINKNRPLHVLFNAYATAKGISGNSLRFLFDGQRMRPDDTAADLGLINDDVIDVHTEQWGGPLMVNVNVAKQFGDRKVAPFPVWFNRPATEVFKLCATAMKQPEHALKFVHEGKQLDGDTILYNILKEDDEIQVFHQSVPSEDMNTFITVTVTSREVEDVQYKLKRTTKLKTITDKVCLAQRGGGGFPQVDVRRSAVGRYRYTPCFGNEQWGQYISHLI